MRRVDAARRAADAARCRSTRRRTPRNLLARVQRRRGHRGAAEDGAARRADGRRGRRRRRARRACRAGVLDLLARYPVAAARRRCSASRCSCCSCSCSSFGRRARRRLVVLVARRRRSRCSCGAGQRGAGAARSALSEDGQTPAAVDTPAAEPRLRALATRVERPAHAPAATDSADGGALQDGAPRLVRAARRKRARPRSRPRADPLDLAAVTDVARHGRRSDGHDPAPRPLDDRACPTWIGDDARRRLRRGDGLSRRSTCRCTSR